METVNLRVDEATARVIDKLIESGLVRLEEYKEELIQPVKDLHGEIAEVDSRVEILTKKIEKHHKALTGLIAQEAIGKEIAIINKQVRDLSKQLFELDKRITSSLSLEPIKLQMEMVEKRVNEVACRISDHDEKIMELISTESIRPQFKKVDIKVEELTENMNEQNQQLSNVLSIVKEQNRVLEEQQKSINRLARPWYRRIFG